MQYTEEVWKDVLGYEGKYQVSSYGRVKSFLRVKSGKILIPRINTNGYYQVCLSYDKIVKTKTIHSLVTITFFLHAPCGHKMVVNHKDFNKLNNRLDNLEIVTQRENSNKKHLKSSSQYVGVYWHRTEKKWRATLTIKRGKMFLGRFATEIEASTAYRAALAEHLKSIS